MRPPPAFKASITPLPRLPGPGGVPEVSSGIPSPPSSPPLAARHATTAKNGKARRGGAAYTITEECERLFCETLRSVFLGEGSQHRQDSLVMGMSYIDTPANTAITNDYGIDVRRYSDSSTDSDIPEMVRFEENKGAITNYIEMWDYVGGVMFRGFVVEREEERSMFVFFDEAVIGADLKAGLMALLELCEIDYFSCSRLVLCIDRHSDQVARNNLTKDLGWIGFGLTTLDDFSQGEKLTSDKWLFMDMEV